MRPFASNMHSPCDMFSSAVSSSIFCLFSALSARRSIEATDSAIPRMTIAEPATRNESMTGEIASPANTMVGSGISVTAPMAVK